MDEYVSDDRGGRRDWLAALLLRQHERFAPRLVTAAARWRATPRGVRRRLGRRVALTAAGTALALSMVAGPLLPTVRAATITVDESTCTLIDAIRSANADTSYGGCVSGSGFDAIQLETDVTLTGSYGTYYGSDTGLPLITSAMSIDGDGHTIARDTSYAPFRLMAVGPTGDLTLEDATLTGGYSTSGGGALVNYGGEMYIFDSTFTGNTAFAGGGVANYGLAFIAYSDISGNSATVAGGLANAFGGYAYVLDTTLSDNSAYAGGGMYNFNALAGVFDSAITNNGATAGGGATTAGGATIFANSTISGNFAFGAGGLYSIQSSTIIYSSAVVYNFAYFAAGGIANVDQGHVDIGNSTVSGNYGSLYGGGIFSDDSTTHPFHTTISGNYAYAGGGVAGSYLYVLGGAGAQAHVEGNRLGQGAFGGRAAPADRLGRAAPEGMNLDGSRLAALNSRATAGARLDRDEWIARATAAGIPVNAGVPGSRPDGSRLNGSRLSGDLVARVQSALPASGHAHHEGTGPDAFAYYTQLAHSIVSGNYGTIGRELFAFNADAIESYDYNVLAHDGVTSVEAFYGVVPSGTDFVATSDAGNVPLGDIIEWLAFNGGDTLNHALPSGSPAIDMVGHGLPVDQRYYARPVNGYYDSGTYEVTPVTDMLVSSDSTGVTDDAVAFGPHDILRWEEGSGWSKWFDGSAAGLVPNGKAKHNVNAIWVPDADTVPYAVMSFAQNARFVPNISGKVDGMDLVWWDGASFSLFFDGQDVGLTQKTNEKIDALQLLPPWMAPDELLDAAGACSDYILISTQGPGAVPGLNGVIRFSGEDVLGFCATQLGSTTKGKWMMVLDGSEQGMPRNSLANLSASNNGKTLYLMTRAAFNVDSATGGHSMLYQYDLGSEQFTGPTFIAADEGLHEFVDALEQP